ncbi:MbnP family protein [Hymenobacter cavernae]|uniref:Copper-binding protein MbnP-like domain-containing protein n=1 Tax=Hymenobacter cavernae TaxID=2044852 RepID=A0ABQ1UJU9_9BACT|nr:MbnP family protein [Hymenobacter cavernae]GGF18566.1 hypothetical protein GCM10011383_32590 [Hymenobacter cavernae]
MLFSRFSALFLALAITAISLTGCDKDDSSPASNTGELDIEIENVVGTTPLALNTGTYTTEAGDHFTVTKFNYYISNIKLKKADGTEFVQPDSYYLVKESDATSHHFTIPDVPIGDYTSINFTIGVDSLHNVSGAQRGALDPSNDMFWSWNSGYIFLKLEGTSPDSPSKALVFHIGGFMKPYNTIRTVSPSFNGKTVMVRTDHTPEIHFHADVLKMFTGMRFADASSTSHSAGANAVRVADNYAAGMFSVDHIHAN